ncbi:hypothetical protein PSN01_02546 [Micromonospora saelicesensis]|nr:hypothetical protein PSN01_02546 [Micromonospora saelicesensis]
MLGGEDGEADDGEHRQQVDSERPGEAATAEQREVDHRVRPGPLPVQEERPHQQTADDGEDPHRAEAVAGHLLDAVDHRQQRAERQCRADQVEPPGRRVAELGHQERHEQEQHQHRRDVDQEDRAPPEVLQQDATEHRADRDATGEGGGPDADGGPALFGVVEHVAHQGERRGHQGGPTDAEHGTGGDQRRGAVGVRGQQRRRTERGGADQQESASADPVTQSAHGDEQPGQHEAVDVEDPELFGGGGTQLRADERDGEVEHRHVHRDQEQRQHQHREPDPLPPARSRCRCGGDRHDQFSFCVGRTLLCVDHTQN